jgi:hypothetical protein
MLRNFITLQKPSSSIGSEPASLGANGKHTNHYTTEAALHIPISAQTETGLYIVTYSGFYIHDGTLLHSKSQYTTVKHSRQLFEHTYTSDPHGLRTFTPIEFFRQDLLWKSSNTHSNSCSQKAFKHTSGQSIIGLSVRLHTTRAPRRIVHHLPAPTIGCLHSNDSLTTLTSSFQVPLYHYSITIVTSPFTLLCYYGNATN